MSNSIMRKIAKFIVEKHIIIMLLFVVLVIYSALSISKVRVNEDITALLPPKTATRRGLTVMEMSSRLLLRQMSWFQHYI